MKFCCLKKASASLELLKGGKMPFGKTGLKIQKHSPAMLMAVGTVGFVGTIVLASKATLKAKVVMTEHAEKLNTVAEAQKVLTEDYTEKDILQDKVVVYTQTATALAVTYAPTVVLGATTLACFLGAYNIVSKRNAALAAAYSLVETAFGEYRERVTDELGLEWDRHFRYGGTIKKITEIEEDPETGKKVKTKKFKNLLPDDLKGSMYSVVFEPIQRNGEKRNSWTGSSRFYPVHQYNHFFLVTSQNRMNDRLNADGYLFLNDVYDHLGFPRTEAGQLVGWVKGSKNGDGVVVFCDGLDMASYNDGDPILLDFNVDGPILDQI